MSAEKEQIGRKAKKKRKKSDIILSGVTTAVELFQGNAKTSGTDRLYNSRINFIKKYLRQLEIDEGIENVYIDGEDDMILPLPPVIVLGFFGYLGTTTDLNIKL